MKKIAMAIFVLIYVSGCSSSTSGTMKCTSTSKQEQMTSNVVLQVTYEDDIVIAQESDTTITTNTLDAYEQIQAIVETSKAVYEGMKGTEFTYESDVETRTIHEVLKIDFHTISSADKDKILSYEDGDMNVNNIKEVLESQSFTCSK